MGSFKILYGIDLGTTNSAITRFENGKAVVKKNVLQCDTTPSCVSFNKNGKIQVGAKARAQLSKDRITAYKRPGYKSNTYIEFKRLMGTDHRYDSTNLGREIAPEELSAEVLKDLRKNVLDEQMTAAVITVPAMFNNTQKDATKRAARMAGFEQVELIQEPVAASIAYGIDSKMKNGYWIVFDFGGGTFDAALMKIEDGIMQAIDTDGNNKLGGKDIDKAIVDQVIMPYLKRNYTLDDILARKSTEFADMWKDKAEEAKIRLSYESSYEIETDLGDDYGTDDIGEEIALSLTLTREEFGHIAAPIFQKAIDITLGLMRRNNLDGASLGALILVGGPTHSPIVRQMLRDQITPNVDTSIDPMTCVAAGAAIYGSTIDLQPETADKKRDTSKVQLQINHQSTTVEDEEWVSVSLLRNKSADLRNSSVRVEFSRADGLFTSPQSEVDEVGDVINLILAKNKANVFNVHCYDQQGKRLECEPNQITIIQGIAGLGDAVMPMAIGLGVLDANGIEVFHPIEGLEKSRKLPATGHINGRRTPKDIRPGVVSDEIRMSLYQIAEADKGVNVLYCQRVYDVLLTGDDLPSILPAGSIINISLHAERSGTIDHFEVDIPVLGIKVDLTDRITGSTTSLPSQTFMTNQFEQAKSRARRLEENTLEDRVVTIQQKYHANPSDRDTADSALSELQAIGREMDKLYANGEWDRQVKRLHGMLNELKQDNLKYGDQQTTSLVDQLQQEMNRVLLTHDVQIAKELYSKMWALDFRIAEVDFYRAWFYNWDNKFYTYQWKNPSRARELVNKGKSIINSGPTANALKPIADELIDLSGTQPPTDVLT